jgi:hypothetical protein
MQTKIEQLMDARHCAFLTAKAGDFQREGDTKAWREANRAYVLEKARQPLQKAA